MAEDLEVWKTRKNNNANRVWKNETQPYKYSLVFISESPQTMPAIYDFSIFFSVFSWCSWRHRESSSACIHHYDSTSSSHHLRSPAPLLFLLSKIIISSSNIGFILIQHLREQGAFLSTRDLRMPATICVSNDHLDGGSGVSTPYDCSTDRWRSQGLFLRLLGSTHPRNRSLPFSLKFLATWQDRLPKIVRKSCSHGATRKVVLFRR